MHIRNIDLNLLVIFAAVVEERSTSKAADRLGMSQSGVSHALSRLRDLLSDPLFLRTKKGMIPTAKAIQIAPDISAGLQLLHGAVSSGADFDPKTDKSRFRLLLPDLGETLFLPGLLNYCASEAPHIRIDIQAGFGRGFADDLAKGHIHFAMELLPPDRSDIGYAQWFTSDIVAVSNGPQYEGIHALSRDLYSAARHILYQPPGLSEPPLEPLLKAQGTERTYAARTATLAALMFVAAETDSLATVPRQLAEAFSARTRIHTMELPFLNQNLTSYLWWPRSSENQPAQAWLRKTLLSLT